MRWICLLGRILFSLLFIVKPIEHFSSGAIAQAQEMGVPFAHLFVPLWGVLALLGGLSILCNYKARLGALFLVLFLLPTTFYMHPFWMMEEGMATTMHGLCFWKNLSLLGAALLFSQKGVCAAASCP